MGRKKNSDGIPMDPTCPRCGGKHGVEVSGDGYEWDCAACGGHLMCAIGADGGEMFPYHREDGSCGCESEPHTCDMDEDERAELVNANADLHAESCDEEIARLTSALEAMTRARDEACDLVSDCLDRMTALVDEHGDSVVNEPGYIATENKLAELRKVGAK